MCAEKQKKYFAGQKSHGVHIPPRKKQEGKSITLEFVLTGTVPSKKNMQIPTFDRVYVPDKVAAFAISNKNSPTLSKDIRKIVRDIRCYIHNSANYTKWVARQKEVIVQQAQANLARYGRHDITFPIARCSVSIVFYWADDRTRDNSNKAETIHDLLVSCGIIEDDNYSCLFKHSAEGHNYKGEINQHIAQVFITAYL